MAGSGEGLDQTAEADRALWPREGECPSSESSAEQQEWLKHGDDVMGFGFRRTLLEEASCRCVHAVRTYHYLSTWTGMAFTLYFRCVCNIF